MDQAPKKLFIKTYGCQMNVYDSERMAEALGASGYVTTEVADEADMKQTGRLKRYLTEQVNTQDMNLKLNPSCLFYCLR